MKRLPLALVLCLIAGSMAWAAGPELKSGEMVLRDENVRCVAGSWNYYDRPVSVAGHLYSGYGTPGYGLFATFDIRGWDHFQAYVGVNDDNGGHARGVVSIEVDGEQLWQRKVNRGEKAVRVDIALTGRQTLTIRKDDSYPDILEPKLIKGRAVSRPPDTVGGDVTPVPSAPIAVDPNVLKVLAESLREQVTGDAQVAARIAQGQVAISTFSLIDIPSPSVAQNVAEDLTTAMIKARFHLVERGQLDKVLKELKIQNMGLVDSATAQKIGRLSGCDVILLGSISDRGQFVVINARLMETATGKSLAAAQVEMRKIPIQRGK